MAENQAANPETPGTSPAAEAPGQGGSILTGKAPTAEVTTPPLAEGGAPKTPPAWVAQLPDDLKANERLHRYANLGELGKAYLEAERKLGESVRLPGKDATEEERAAYRKAAGVPDKPTDYKLDKAKAPAGFEYPAAMEASLRELAHKAGLTQEQAAQMHRWHQMQRLTEAETAAKTIKATLEQTDAELRAELRGNYDLEMGYMQRGVQRYFTPDIADLFTRTGLGNDKRIIRMFAKIGRDTAEHAFVEGQATKPVPKDPAEVLYPNQK
ncbi:MAG: hypothetical protein WC683_07945 [bacterium]